MNSHSVYLMSDASRLRFGISQLHISLSAVREEDVWRASDLYRRIP
jgi:hypothetical protein